MKHRKKKRSPARQLVLAAKDRLGKESDRSLAQDLGVSQPTVARARWALGIPSYGQSKVRVRGVCPHCGKVLS